MQLVVELRDRGTEKYELERPLIPEIQDDLEGFLQFATRGRTLLFRKDDLLSVELTSTPEEIAQAYVEELEAKVARLERDLERERERRERSDGLLPKLRFEWAEDECGGDGPDDNDFAELKVGERRSWLARVLGW